MNRKEMLRGLKAIDDLAMLNDVLRTLNEINGGAEMLSMPIHTDILPLLDRKGLAKGLTSLVIEAIAELENELAILGVTK